jgi:hypothetical protein
MQLGPFPTLDVNAVWCEHHSWAASTTLTWGTSAAIADGHCRPDRTYDERAGGAMCHNVLRPIRLQHTVQHTAAHTVELQVHP